MLTLAKVVESLNLTQVEAAKILNESQVTINRRVKRGDEIKISELIKLQERFKTNLFKKFFPQFTGDALEIVYWENPKLEKTIKSPKITSIWIDRELTQKDWQKNEKNLRVIKMPGSSMEGGHAPIYNGDILVLDIEDTDIIQGGVFAYTTQDKNLIFVRYIKQDMEGNYKFIARNDTVYAPVSYTKEALEAMDFKVIGRVIKDLSLKLSI